MTENVDEVVGLIVAGSVIAADEIADGSVFGYYDHPGRYDDLERQRMKQNLEQYGYQLQQLYQQSSEAGVSDAGSI